MRKRGTSVGQPVPAVVIEPWKVGDEALLVGIASRPSLNGQRVRVVSVEGVRIAVQFGNHECIKVLPDRLALPHEPSAWRDTLMKPDDLHAKVVQAWAEGDKSSALELGFEALQIARNYGSIDRRLLYRKKATKQYAEHVLKREMARSGTQHLKEMLKTMEAVNAKLKLDAGSQKRAMNATLAGRLKWAAMQAEGTVAADTSALQESLESGFGPHEAEVQVVRSPTFNVRRSVPKELNVSSLPAFNPPSVDCGEDGDPEGVPLCRAFACTMPGLAKLAVMSSPVEGLPSQLAPPLQWNYSMFHLCHYYSTGLITKFQIEDDLETESLLLEVCSVHACPYGIGLAREDFKTSDGLWLGAPPLLSVRYFHDTKATMRPDHATIFKKFLGSGAVVKIRAASSAEVRYGKDALSANSLDSGTASRSRRRGTVFRRSVLFPPRKDELEDANKHVSPLYLCSFCHKSSATKLLSCSRCLVTKYCGQECQRLHWKNGHKNKCDPRTGSSPQHNAPDRCSLVVQVPQQEQMADGMYRAEVNFSCINGTSSVRSTSKAVQAELSKSLGVAGAHHPRNVYGDREFIVKLQPSIPVGPWMCYDEPRSFQFHVPESTHNLDIALEMLRDRGIRAQNPLTGAQGLKGYFNARWEGKNLRIFLDDLAPRQLW